MLKSTKQFFLVVVFCVLLPVEIFAQQTQEQYVTAIKQTLPAYLNKNPNSLASLLRNGNTLNLFYGIFKNADSFITDSSELLAVKSTINQLESAADSVALVLKENKIIVEISDTLYPYRYMPSPYCNLKDDSEWEDRRKLLENEFQTNTLAFSDTVTDIDFIPLIRKQILNDYTGFSIDLNQLNESYYIFKTECDSNYSEDLCFKAYRLYQPLFNERFTKRVLFVFILLS